MKADRRHKLQTNSLAQVINDFPTFWNDYGAKAALWLLLAALLIVVLYYRLSGSGAARQQDLQSLATLREKMELLRFTPMQEQAMTSEQYQTTSESADELRTEFNHLDEQTSDPHIKAETHVAIGDLDWMQANYPVAGNVEQTIVQYPNDRSNLLEQARAEYQQVLDKYSNQPLSVTSARLGLAAIAETNRDFDAAGEQLNSLIQAPGIDPLLKQWAKASLDSLKDLQKTIYLGKAPVELPFTFPLSRPTSGEAGSATGSTTGEATTLPMTGLIPSSAPAMSLPATATVAPTTVAPATGISTQP